MVRSRRAVAWLIPTIRWTARVCSVAAGVVVLAFLAEHLKWVLGDRLPPASVLVALAFHFLMLVGLVVAWRWEVLGASSILGGGLGFLIALGDGLRFLPIVGVVWVPAMLWLCASWLGRRLTSPGRAKTAMRKAIRLSLIVIAAAASPCWADCDAFWMRIHGKGERRHVTFPDETSLLQFARQQPLWDPARYDAHGRYLGPSEPVLSWKQLPALASISFVGKMDGRRVYLATYSRYYVVVLSEQDDWTFCPSLILDADAGFDAGQVVAFLGRPEIFQWKGRDLLSLRVYYRGMGAVQDALFLTKIDEQVVYLEKEDFGERITRDGWQMRSRGGGFCRYSLRFEHLADRQDPARGVETALISVVYRVSGRRLLVDSVVYTPVEATQKGEPCELYYESPGAG
jgi:hypothetical protein